MVSNDRLEKLEKQRQQLDAKIKAEKLKVGKEERKARNHAAMVIGGLVLTHFDSWKCVDWDKLAVYLNTYGYKISECVTEPLETKDAAARLREWERRR